LYNLGKSDDEANPYISHIAAAKMRDFLVKRGIGWAQRVQPQLSEEVGPFYRLRIPLIKGNVSQKTGERIYHLPDDEYYDETIVHYERGERYFLTEEEANDAGWRRAYV